MLYFWIILELDVAAQLDHNFKSAKIVSDLIKIEGSGITALSLSFSPFARSTISSQFGLEPFGVRSCLCNPNDRLCLNRVGERFLPQPAMGLP